MNKPGPLIFLFLFSCMGISAQTSLFRFGVSAFPNYSYCYNRFGASEIDLKSNFLSVSADVFSELQLHHDFSLQLGAGISTPGYRRPPYQVTAEYPDDPALPSKVKGRFTTQCVIIPYNLIWQPGPMRSFFISAGLTSLLSFAKKHTIVMVYEDKPNKKNRNIDYDLQYGYGAQIGAGKSIKLSKSLIIDIGAEFRLLRTQFDQAYESAYYQAGIKTAVKI